MPAGSPASPPGPPPPGSGGGGRADGGGNEAISVALAAAAFGNIEVTSTVATGVWSLSLRNVKYSLEATMALISFSASSGETQTVTEPEG